MMGLIRSHRFISAILGLLLICGGLIAFWYLMALASFSSQLRDDFEAPPGTLEVWTWYLALVMALLAIPFGAFVALLAAMSRRVGV